VALRCERALLEGLPQAEVEQLDSLLGKLTASAQALSGSTRARRR
jgi:hypothetical protein